MKLYYLVIEQKTTKINLMLFPLHRILHTFFFEQPTKDDDLHIINHLYTYMSVYVCIYFCHEKHCLL